ncbi:MAG: phosphatidate cytidylyltransferase [Gemmatimonadetes bacterium]|nr:phosphatidate cytidylyltransferase [Gemmatimonadota bacterium]
MPSAASTNSTPLGDLGKRVFVAVLGIPTVLGLLYVGGWAVGVPLALMAALGVREIGRLAAAHGVQPFRWLGMLGAAALVLAAVQWPSFVQYAPWALSILGVVLAVSMVAMLFSRSPKEHPLGSVAVTVFGVAYLGLSLASVVLLDAMPAARGWSGVEESRWAGAMVVLLPIAATWIGDAAAYFAGSAWGRRKLAPRISPKKSWVGLWTELAAAALAGVAWMEAARTVLPRMPVRGAATAAVLGIALGLGAVLGDLVESLFKREAGVKDSGSVFPGHGGVLDRLDALVFTLPLAYVLLSLVEAVR